MAKRADQLEQELELRRRALHDRVDQLRQRAAGDVRGMQHETQEELHKVESRVGNHLWLAMAGGLGSGIALGAKAPSLRTVRQKVIPGKSQAKKRRNRRLLMQGLGMLAALGGSQVMHEVRGTMHNATRGAIHKAVSRSPKQAPAEKSDAPLG